MKEFIVAAGIKIKRLINENAKLQQIIDSLLRENYDLRSRIGTTQPKGSNESKRT